MNLTTLARDNLDALWMPFTANRQFKRAPRLLVQAEGMYYTEADGRKILDGTAGLWCVNAGHKRRKIVQAIQRQVEELDYAPPFQMGHPRAFELAARIAELTPKGIDRVFFTNSGSESTETALKIALAYHRARGEGSRCRLIGRERGYHGVNFGGVSVGGIGATRKMFAPLLPGVDHIRHTHDLHRNAFSRGQPQHGVELADDLERLVQLHDASTIAAVIVEPVAGSAGVLVPPKGYLERLRAVCDQYGILLIFDEVITGFGRLGASFAATAFGVTPDIMAMAKGLTNATVPAGAVCVKREIHDAFMSGPEGAVELAHGYTYSGHPLACAAGLATLDTYREEGLFERAAELSSYWADALHSLKGFPHVIDIRNMGLMGAIELEPIEGHPTKRGFSAFLKVYEKDCMIRTTGDIIAMSPPLIIQESEINRLVDTVGTVLKQIE